MGLEAATYINDLTITNPIGATDPKSQGDDHIRLIKEVLKNTFPNLSYAATGKGADIASASPLVLGNDGNYFDVTGSTGFSVITVVTGRFFILQFDSSLTITHGAGITCPRAENLAVVAGDQIICYSTAANNVFILVHLPASGNIKFKATQSTSADANTLDDYEEGTWTPALTFDTPGNLSVTYTTQVGRYTKIGDSVRINFRILLSTFTHTTAAGNAKITGLPFTSFATANNLPAIATEWAGITKAGFTSTVARVLNNATYMDLLQGGTGQASTQVGVADMPTGGVPLFSGAGIYQV